MDILGVSCFFHDSAAALLRDGELVAASMEERLTRKKHDSGFPAMAIQFCLDRAGIQGPDLESVVALYRNELAFADWETVQLPHRLRHVGETRDPYGRLAPGEAFTPAIMINNGFHMDGHRFLYDFATLAQTLRLAGFAKVVRASFGESAHAALRGIGRHDGGATGASWVPRVALVVEASA